MNYDFENTLAYHAGKLTGVLYTCFSTRNDLPPVILCMRDFEHLRTIFGKYYNLLKINKVCNSFVVDYEKFIFMFPLDNETKGGIDEFMMGYVKIIRKNRIRKQLVKSK